MDTAALEARLARLEQEVAELRRENQSLRATPTKEGTKEGESLPRRAVLTGAAYALGAVSLSLMGTRPAEATVGFMQYGTSNNSGTSETDLLSSGSLPTLLVQNSVSAQQSDPFWGQALLVRTSAGHGVGVHMFSESVGNGVNVMHTGQGHGVLAEKPSSSEFGHGVLAYQRHPASFYAAVAGVTSGAGPGLHGRGEGTGQGVWGEINDSSKTQAAVIGTTEGSGAAIEGRSVLGRGGVFRGKKAQIRLVASTATTKPATGSRGDLFVDSSGRLWYCKTGGSTTGWKQLA